MLGDSFGNLSRVPPSPTTGSVVSRLKSEIEIWKGIDGTALLKKDGYAKSYGTHSVRKGVATFRLWW